MNTPGALDWGQLATAFEAVLAAAPDQRERVIIEVAGHDAAMAGELRSLLAAQSAAGRALDRPLLRQAQHSLPPASTLGSWTLLRVIGRGGMGEVWLAERNLDGVVQQVAIKRPPLADPLLLGRLARERRLLARLSHPAIPALIDSGTDAQGQPFFAMAFVEEARHITQYCRAEGLDLDARVQLMLKVCEAVSHAHQHLVVHGDLKPGNVVVSPDGYPHLLDFGLARSLAESVPTEQSAAQMLTPAYASPERRAGAAPSTAGDVYSLGVLLFELLAGQRPEPDLPTALPSAQVNATGTADTDARLARRLRGDLDAIVSSAMHPEPSRRYSSVAALTEDLRRWRQGWPLSVRDASWHYQLRCLLRRHRVAAASAALLLLALAGLVAQGWRTARLEAEHARVLTIERDRAESVVDFMQELLATTNPLQASTAAVTARDVLDTGASRLLSPAAGGLDPVARAAAMAALAGAYRAQGHYTEAQELLTTAAGLEKQLPPLRRAELQLQGAKLHYRLEQLATARAQAQAALELALTALPPDSPRLAPFIGALALTQMDSGALEAAESSMRHVIRLLESSTAQRESLAYGIALADLADLLQTREELPAARDLYQRSLGVFARHGSAGEAHSAITYNALGRVYNLLEQTGESLAAYDRALEIARAGLGDTHPFVGVVLRSRGKIQREAGRPELALQDYLAAVQGAGHLPDNHPARLRSELGLALTELALGQRQSASQRLQLLQHSEHQPIAEQARAALASPAATP